MKTEKRTTHTQLVIPDEIFWGLKRLAADKHTTFREVTIDALEKYVKQENGYNL